MCTKPGPAAGEVLRLRTISRLGVDVRVGVGPSITVAATASAQTEAPGGVLAIAPDHAAEHLATSRPKHRAPSNAGWHG
ncbi:hypothetical protein ACFWHV_22110 [Streptomyces collinus]|uniref:hypothetical protein n=1 Tax=Streptomyces collinus TaxID=42684 RepID=UPI0036581881